MRKPLLWVLCLCIAFPVLGQMRQRFPAASDIVMIHSAAGQHSTTYLSVGATPMTYGLFITAERYQ